MDLSISAVAERQTPTLARSSTLIRRLGACMLFAATPRAATISIDRVTSGDSAARIVSRSHTSDLGSELDRIANDGLDCFSDANTYLNKIKYTVGSIARPNGPLQTLAMDFGSAEAMNNNERLLARIERAIVDSVQYGQELTDKFEKWQKNMRSLNQALRPEHAKLARTTDRIISQIEENQVEVDIAQSELNQAKEAETAAREKYEQALTNEHSVDWNQMHIPGSSNVMEYFWCFASVTKLGMAWYTSKTSEIVVNNMHREFERRKQIADHFRLDLQDARVALESTQQQKVEINKITNAVQLTLNAMDMLAGDVRGMITEFTEMKTLVEMLIQRQRDGLNEIAVSSDLRNSYDIKQFASDALEMRGWAIKVEHLAWLYAEIIRQIMMQGLGDLGNTTKLSQDEVDMPLLIEAPDMESLPDSEQNSASGSVVSLVYSQVDQSFRENFESIRRSAAANEANPSSSSEQQARQEGARSKLRRVFRRSK